MQQVVECPGSITQGSFLDPAKITEGAGMKLLDGGPEIDGGVSICANQADFLKRHSAYVDATVIIEKPDVHDHPARAHGR